MNKINYKILFIVLGLILIFLLGKQCGNGSKNDLKPITDTLIINKKDTIRDTLTVFKTKEKRVFKYETITKYIDSTKCNNIVQYRVYKDTIRDTNIVIFNNDTVLGYITSRNLSYKLLVPIKIYDSTIVKINKNIPVLPKFRVQTGISGNFNNIYLNLELSNKRNNYNIYYNPLNKQILLGYKYTIFYR